MECGLDVRQSAGRVAEAFQLRAANSIRKAQEQVGDGLIVYPRVATRIQRAASMASQDNGEIRVRMAVAIGVGAGAFEAALLGAAAAGSGMVVLLNVPQARESVAPVMSLMLAATPLAWLVGPVERAITIPCHVSSRVLALLGVARGKWTPFWVGFAMITLVDVVAGFAHVSGRLGMFSIWWLELAILPFAILSLPLTVWAARKWPLTNASRAPDSPAQLLSVGPSNP